MEQEQGLDYIDLREIVAILRRQARLIALTMLVVLAVAFLYLVKAVPQYTATALLKIETRETNVLDPSQIENTNATTDSSKLETEVGILKSASLALKTISSLELVQTPEFGPQVGLTDRFRMALGMELPPAPTGEELVTSALGKFNNAVSVRRQGLTYLINLAVTTPDPDLSARIANAHALTYIQDQIAGKSAATIAARDVLSSELEQARARLSESDSALRNYISTNIDRLEQESGSEAVAELRRRLDTANSAFTNAEGSLQMASAALDAGDWTTLSQQVGDTALAALEQQRQTLQARLSGVAEGSTEAVDLTQGLAAIEARMRQQGTAAVATLDQQLGTLRDSRSQIVDSIQTEILNTSLSAETLTDIYSLQQEAQIAQRQYDQILGRIRDLETQSVLQVANSRVVSEALAPRSPSAPNRKLVLALALVMGAGLGLGLAFMREYFFGGITSANQLQNILGIKVGAIVPRLSVNDPAEVVADRVVSEPMSIYSEAYRRLRASVDQSSQGGKVIMVSSAIPAEGKTTTALALARTYAMAGKRTVLIDADLRNPSLHKNVHEHPEAGLLDYLLLQEKIIDPQELPALYQADSEDATAATHFEKFFVADEKSKIALILGRKRANVPTDAPLQSETFKNLVAEARNSFDIVVIDTAPLVPVVDPRYIAPYADVAVLCVRFGAATQSELRNAYGQLRESLRPDKNIVAMLNCMEGEKRTYRYEAYYH